MFESLPVKEGHEFAPHDFVGGDPVLDFVNTVTGRDGEPSDRLDIYLRFVEWAALAGVVSMTERTHLERMCEREPARAETALAAARVLRETLFELFTAIARGEVPQSTTLDALNADWASAMRARTIVVRARHLVIEEGADAVDLVTIAVRLAYRAVEFGSTFIADRLRLCAGENCAWLYYDTSKAGRRRWCDMAVCGNSAKARRFAQRNARRQLNLGG